MRICHKVSKKLRKVSVIHVGFDLCNGDVVFTMDADLQDDPREIPEMYDLIKNDNYDLDEKEKI